MMEEQRQRPVAVVVAMEAEVRHLREHLTIDRDELDGPWRDEFATVGALPVLLLRDVVIGTGTVPHSKLNIRPSGEELYPAATAEVGGELWAPTELDADPR